MAVLLLAARIASGQASESATAGKAMLWVGASASGYYIQYGTIKELGVSGFVDADTARRFGIEGERIDQLHPLHGRHLHQAQHRLISVLPDELGVEGEAGVGGEGLTEGFGERLQRGGSIDIHAASTIPKERLAGLYSNTTIA